MMFARLSGTGVSYCDHTVHFSADLSLWLDSPNVLGTRTPFACPPQTSFPVPPGRQVDVHRGPIMRSRVHVLQSLFVLTLEKIEGKMQ